LETLKLAETTSDFEIGSPFAAIASCMCEREVVFRVEAVFDEWIDVVNVELTLVQH
jgi:hypothetical protein